jgi:hypothetical protein
MEWAFAQRQKACEKGARSSTSILPRILISVRSISTSAGPLCQLLDCQRVVLARPGLPTHRTTGGIGPADLARRMAALAPGLAAGALNAGALGWVGVEARDDIGRAPLGRSYRPN